MSLQAQIDSPLEAAIFYFPSPATIRCLNHSNIPKSFRKGLVTRSINIPNEGNFEQTITIGVSSKGTQKKFVLKGNIRQDEEIVSMKLSKNPFFNSDFSRRKSSSLFGLEDILGLQKKVHVTDKIGNQILNYEVFLKTTKGMIGNEKYNLELFGQDKSINGQVKYFLDGKGIIGKDKITVTARGVSDYYEIKEQYGEIEAFTIVKVYD